jgi:hypothetical protein
MCCVVRTGGTSSCRTQCGCFGLSCCAADGLFVVGASYFGLHMESTTEACVWRYPLCAQVGGVQGLSKVGPQYGAAAYRGFSEVSLSYVSHWCSFLRFPLVQHAQMAGIPHKTDHICTDRLLQNACNMSYPAHPDTIHCSSRLHIPQRCPPMNAADSTCACTVHVSQSGSPAHQAVLQRHLRADIHNDTQLQSHPAHHSQLATLANPVGRHAQL